MSSIDDLKKFEAYLWGIIAEWLSYMYLFLKAYSPIDRRWKSPVGEIDIVAYKNKLLVFIEVKARPSIKAGLEAVSVHQRIRIENAARSWIAIDLRIRRSRFAA
jgi:putative endonuclease